MGMEKQIFEHSQRPKKGKAVVDIQVENVLLKRALGYSSTETVRQLDTDTGKLVVTRKATEIWMEKLQLERRCGSHCWE